MQLLRRFALLATLLLLALACADSRGAPAEEHYYAIEVNGTLAGYAHVQSWPGELDGRPTTRVEQRIFILLSVLGAEFDTEIKQTLHLDETGQYLSMVSELKQGRTDYQWSARVEGEQAVVRSPLKAGDVELTLTPDVIRGNPLTVPHFRRDFVDAGLEGKTYDQLEIQDAEIQQIECNRSGDEQLELAGQSFDSVGVECLNLKNGVKSKIWFEPTTARFLRAEFPNDRVVYLATASVVKKIELVNVDEDIIAGAGVSIPDFQNITYMKVRAVIEPTGYWVTPEDLTVPGQRFEGTVVENRIEGVFEIETVRYDGTDAPPFPPDFTADESLAKFLEPSGMIQSDDPVLIEKARSLTAGSADAWEAVQRINRWVSEHIDYAIPGGGSARRTYDLGAGECGSHSNLVAAFSRAVGIPARMVWGGTYIPTHGGAFGQHGWNEVYMGKAGWIQTDSTAHESDYADAGHIRLGVAQTGSTALNPVEFEVLDYRLGTGEPRPVATDKYDAYLGEYTNAENGRTMTVLLSDGALAVDIPDQLVLLLRDPDERGAWFAKISPKLYVTFQGEETGEIDGMQIHEIVRMQRIEEPEEIGSDIPDTCREYLGTYLLAQVNAEFEVICRVGQPAVVDPLGKRTILLRPAEQPDSWSDESGRMGFSFERDDEGRIRAMKLDAATELRR